MNLAAELDPRYLSILDAANATTKVGSLTHSFYRYPARFGETFVREAVQQFSRAGEIVLDPFCGGGTTLVEALAAGRHAIGSDVSELAVFVARAKTSPLSAAQLSVIEAWLSETTASTKKLIRAHRDSTDPRLANVPGLHRNLISAMRQQVEALPRGESRRFASCLLLKSAQWALDGKEHLPTPTALVDRMHECYAEMRAGMNAYVAQLDSFGISKQILNSRRRLQVCSAGDLSTSRLRLQQADVSLVVTSPPYLGVHVLYHRWQLQGRRELKAPYFITRCNDRGGASAYTLVSRQTKTTEKYFAAIRSSFAAIKSTLRENAYVVQLVSFADAAQSLPRYLQSMTDAGLQLCDTYLRSAGALTWRPVPGRRWYARVGAVESSSAAHEVLLIHRKGR